MRVLFTVLLLISAAAMADVRTGGGSAPNPWSSRGTYTIEDIFAGGLSNSYGLAIKDNATNSIWILNWSEMADYEFDMAGGSQTGNSWSITGGVDPDDQAFCEYSGGAQFFMTDYSGSWFGVFADDGSFLRNIDGPSGYTNLFGIGAGHDMLYVGGPNESKLAWGGPYTGTETSVSWTGEMDYESVYGLAVYGDYLFVACGVAGSDNIFIHTLDAAGVPSASPIWSCEFTESGDGTVNGGIDYDGQYLWIYPQNDFLYKLSIDFSMALESETWAGIKASF